MTEPKARRLKAIAEWINSNLPELIALIERGHCNTDRKPKGMRYITHKGKGRVGNRIKVYVRRSYHKDGLRAQPLLDHNAAETYRTNREVEDWLSKYIHRPMRVSRL